VFLLPLFVVLVFAGRYLFYVTFVVGCWTEKNYNAEKDGKRNIKQAQYREIGHGRQVPIRHLPFTITIPLVLPMRQRAI
jgi:hypothetical protein